MDCHVEDAEVELAQVEEGAVDVFDADLLLDQVVGNLCTGEVVIGEGLELRWGPAPVFEHLTRCFDEISDDGCSVEARVFCSSGKIMDSMAEFVEESNDFIVLQKRWFRFCRLGEIANKCCGWVSTSAIRVCEAGLEREVCCVAILSFTRMKIQVEVANESTTFTFIIPNAENFDIFMPCDIFSFAGCYHTC